MCVESTFALLRLLHWRVRVTVTVGFWGGEHKCQKYMIALLPPPLVFIHPQVLFGGDYATVTHRVAFGSGHHLMLTAAERLALGGSEELVGLVEWVLTRDPLRRPTLDAIAERAGAIRASLLSAAAQLPAK